MTKSKAITTAITLDAAEKETLQEMAKAKRISLSALLREGGRLFGEFDKYFLDRVTEYSVKFQTIPSRVIQALVISAIAFDDAIREIEGPNLHRPRQDFSSDGNGPVLGENLYRIMKEQHKRDLKYRSK